MNGVRTSHWGCIYVVRSQALYKLGTIRPGQVEGYEYLYRVASGEELVYMIYTDWVDYVWSQLTRYFHWKHVSGPLYRLNEADLNFIRSIRMRSPMDVLAKLLPGGSVEDCARIWGRLEARHRFFLPAAHA